MLKKITGGTLIFVLSRLLFVCMVMCATILLLLINGKLKINMRLFHFFVSL